jgi:hypothetical protein
MKPPDEVGDEAKFIPVGDAEPDWGNDITAPWLAGEQNRDGGERWFASTQDPLLLLLLSGTDVEAAPPPASSPGPRPTGKRRGGKARRMANYYSI